MQIGDAMAQWKYMADWLPSGSALMSKTSLCSPSVVNTLSFCWRTLRTKLFSFSLNLLAQALVTGPIGTWIGSWVFLAAVMSSSFSPSWKGFVLKSSPPRGSNWQCLCAGNLSFLICDQSQSPGSKTSLWNPMWARFMCCSVLPLCWSVLKSALA